MLKGKKAIYILIPLNIFIWGFFIYRFYSAYHEQDSVEPVVMGENVKIPIDRDTSAYALNLSYKDPFLKDIKNVKPKRNSYGEAGQLKPVIATVKVKSEPVKTILPEIKYLGLVKNSSTGVATAIVTVNGQSRIVKQNELIEGVVFKSFDNNELIAMFGKEKLTIRK